MKRKQELEDDMSFDVGPTAPAAPAAPAAPMAPSVAPKDVLSAAKVEAVRFHPSKPGYAYDQVETFVDAVIRTLRYLEQRMYQDDLAIHEAEQEVELLNEQIATLKATIEVFRANGDPVRSADGGFATASTINDVDLVAERDALAEALSTAQTEIADLRAYIDEQLAPWISEQEADETSVAATPVAEVEQVAQVEELTAAISPDVPVEQPVEVDEKAVFEATAAAFAAQANDPDDWDEDDLSDEADASPAGSDDDWEEDPAEESPRAANSHFSTPEMDALGVAIDPNKIIPTDDAPYERMSPPKAGAPLPRLLPPEIAAMMEAEENQ